MLLLDRPQMPDWGDRHPGKQHHRGAEAAASLEIHDGVTLCRQMAAMTLSPTRSSARA